MLCDGQCGKAQDQELLGRPSGKQVVESRKHIDQTLSKKLRRRCAVFPTLAVFVLVSMGRLQFELAQVSASARLAIHAHLLQHQTTNILPQCDLVHDAQQTLSTALRETPVGNCSPLLLGSCRRWQLCRPRTDCNCCLIVWGDARSTKSRKTDRSPSNGPRKVYSRLCRNSCNNHLGKTPHKRCTGAASRKVH